MAKTGLSIFSGRALLLASSMAAMMSVPNSSIAASEKPHGFIGWLYYLHWWGSTREEVIGYADDHVTACTISALNQMGTPLQVMRPSKGNGLSYDCKYRHFMPTPEPQWYGGTFLVCNAGYVARHPGVCVKFDEVAEKNSCTKSNPVVLSSGAKFQTEQDVQAGASLAVGRTYRSLRLNSRGQSAGQAWSFSFDRDIALAGGANGKPPGLVSGALGDGTNFEFELVAGKYVSRYDQGQSLRAMSERYDDWIMDTGDGKLDRYLLQDGLLRLVSSHTHQGKAQYYTYDADGRLASIADAHGRTIAAGWSGNAITSLTGADGGVRYQYDSITMDLDVKGIPGSERLACVSYVGADGQAYARKHYHYEDPNNRFLLTGISDENGRRFATYAYNDEGQAVLSEHANGAGRHQFAYPDATTRIVTDALGAERSIGVRSFSRRRAGMITGESQPAGAGCTAGNSTLTYDTQRTLTSRTNFKNQKTCYFNDVERGLPLSEVSGLDGGAACPASASAPISAATRRLSTRWHPTLPLKTAIAQANRVTTHTYNGQADHDGKVASCAGGALLPDGRALALICSISMQATSDANGAKGFAAVPTGSARTWQYTYNADGRLLTLTGPANAAGSRVTSRHTYYEDTSESHTAGDLASITTGANEVTRYAAYTKSGNPTLVLRPNGQSVTLDYGAGQRLVSSSVRDNTGQIETTRYAYDAAGQLVATQAPDGTRLSYSYDEAHRLTGIADASGNRISFALDAAGNVLQEDVHDAQGRALRSRTNRYDALGRLEHSKAGAQDFGTHYEYDREGNLTRLTDQLGRLTTRDYDGFNRLVREVLPTPQAGAAPPATGLGYDHQDSLTSVTDPRQLVTRYSVDGFGQTTTVVSPDSGASITTYDGAGDVVATRDARGQLTSYKYDAARRVIQAGSSAFTYGAPGTGANGLLTMAVDASGQTSFQYDGFGRIILKTQMVGAGASAKSFAVHYTYGNSGGEAGHLTSITYPGGSRVKLAYGSDGNINTLMLEPANGGKPVALLSDIQYVGWGGVRSWNWGGGAAPVSYVREYDAQGRLVSYPLGHTGRAGNIRILRYDEADRILATAHSAGSTTAPRLDQRYFYDDLDRLTGFDAAAGGQAYTYDLNSNRTSLRIGTASFSYTINATSNHLLLTTGPLPAKRNKYDAAGNLTSDGVRTFTYGEDGRLNAVVFGKTSVTYQYNAFGERVSKSASGAVGNYYIYDATGRLLGEYDAAGLAMQETVYLGSTPVAVMKPGLALPPGRSEPIRIYHIFADHLDTPRIITAAEDRRIVWRWDGADPFGSYPAESVGGAGVAIEYNPRFPGQIFDKESNLHYNYYRDYDPQLGRYVQSDPIGLAGGLNTYGYVGVNPLSQIDPLGLDSTKLNNTSGGRSTFNLPTNGNWGGKCWSGGQHSCGPQGMGTAPPTDSGDACYMAHDQCYANCKHLPDPPMRPGLEKHSPRKACIRTCDDNLVGDLRKLSNDSKKWPKTPRPGTEQDSEYYRSTALKYFGR